MAKSKNTKKAIEPMAVPVHNLSGAVSKITPEPVPENIQILLPKHIAQVADLRDDYQLTVVVGKTNILRFLQGAEGKTPDGDEAEYHGDYGAILLTF